MSEDQTPLPFDPVQAPLPGLEDAGGKPKRGMSKDRETASQIPLMVSARDELPEWPLHPVSPDQLTLGANQEVLPEAIEQPVQLSLLPDPPPWETPEPDPAPSRPAGRLGRRRARRGITPGQGSLFQK